MTNATIQSDETACRHNPAPPRMDCQTKPQANVDPYVSRPRYRAQAGGDRRFDTMSTMQRPPHVPIIPLIQWIMQDKRRMIQFAEAVASAIIKISQPPANRQQQKMKQ